MTGPLVVGLVGGIGAGKSHAAGEFARRGARVIAADPLGHAALRQPDIRGRVLARWPGAAGADGEVDRRALAAVVFADPAERKALEGLVYPWIAERVRAELEASRADPAVRVVVVDAAVMLEAGWNNVCDRIVYVDAPREARLARVEAQRGWTPAEVAAREAAQMPLAEKAARADAVIDNGGRVSLSEQVDELFRRWGVAPAAGPDAEV